MDKGRIKMTVDSVKVAVDSVARPGIEACTREESRRPVDSITRH